VRWQVEGRRDENRVSGGRSLARNRRGWAHSAGQTTSGQPDEGLLFMAYQADYESGFALAQRRLQGEAMLRTSSPSAAGTSPSHPDVHRVAPRPRGPAISLDSGVPVTTMDGSRGVGSAHQHFCSAATCSMVGMSKFCVRMLAGVHMVRTEDFFSLSEALLTCAVGRCGAPWRRPLRRRGCGRG
jgi:hypothetical protein